MEKVGTVVVNFVKDNGAAIDQLLTRRLNYHTFSLSRCVIRGRQQSIGRVFRRSNRSCFEGHRRRLLLRVLGRSTILTAKNKAPLERSGELTVGGTKIPIVLLRTDSGGAFRELRKSSAHPLTTKLSRADLRGLGGRHHRTCRRYTSCTVGASRVAPLRVARGVDGLLWGREGGLYVFLGLKTFSGWG